MKTAIIGAATLSARDFRRKLIDNGLTPEDILNFGPKVGPWEMAIDDSDAEVFLPLQREYLEDVDVIFTFDCEKETWNSLIEWNTEINSILIDAAGTPSDQDALVNPYTTSFPIKENESILSLPSPEALNLVRFLSLLPGNSPVTVDCTVFEPASMLGEPGVQELFGQATSLLNFKPVSKETLGVQSAFSLVPSMRWNEKSFRQQVTSLLNRQVKLNSTAVIAPLFHVYSLSAFIGIKGADRVEEALKRQQTECPFNLVENLLWPDYEEITESEKPVASIRAMSQDKLWLWMQFNHVRCGMGSIASDLLFRLRG